MQKAVDIEFYVYIKHVHILFVVYLIQSFISFTSQLKYLFFLFLILLFWFAFSGMRKAYGQ